MLEFSGPLGTRHTTGVDSGKTAIVNLRMDAWQIGVALDVPKKYGSVDVTIERHSGAWHIKVKTVLKTYTVVAEDEGITHVDSLT